MLCKCRRTKEGHYWLGRPEEKRVQLPKHKKDCTKKQIEVGNHPVPPLDIFCKSRKALLTSAF